MIQFLQSDLVHTFVQVLLHTLWQAVAIALVVVLMLRWLPTAKANLRYLIALAALGAVVGAALVTGGVLTYEPAASNTAHAPTADTLKPSYTHATPPDERASTSDQIAWGDKAFATEPAAEQTVWGFILPRAWGCYLAWGWTIGVGVMLVRLLLSVAVLYGGPSRRGSETDPRFMVQVEQLRRQMRIRQRVRLVQSAAVRTPAVFGVIWPVLLVPAAMLNDMSPEQLRIILAHELAHIRRHDYLVNLLQLLLEAALFFNPAVWWISRQVRIEREACCDASVVNVTGRSVDVAQTLVDVARQLRGSGAAIAPAFAEGGGRNTFVERVRRLVEPGRPARMRLPWYSLCGVMVACLLAVTMLLQGTETMVHAATTWLSPREHMERLVEIEQTYRAHEKTDRNSQERVTLSGMVRAADGLQIPQTMYFTVHAHSHRHTTSTSFTVNDGQFKITSPPGRIRIVGRHENYAPQVTAPRLMKPGETLENIEIVLERGFVSRFRLRDSHGDPVIGAQVKGSWWVESGSYQGFTCTTDENGIGAIEHGADMELRLEARVSGHEYDQYKYRPTARDVPTWQLTAAKPTSGRIVEAETGKPIVGAELLLVSRNGSFNYTQPPRDYGSDRRVLTRTDAKGRFILDTLRADCQYTLCARAENREWQMVYDIRAGQSDHEIRLGPALVVTGRVIGDLSQLGKRHGKPAFYFRNPIQTNKSSTYSTGFWSEVEVRDGVGYFQLQPLIAGPVRVHLGGREHTLRVSEPVGDWVIDLRPEAEGGPKAKPKMRDVVVRLNKPADWPEPTGNLKVTAVSPNRAFRHKYSEPEFEDGAARFQAYVGGKVSIGPGKTVGYWFKRPSPITVPDEAGPMEITIDAIPAGMIYGRVLGTDGQPNSHANNVYLHMVERSPRMPQGFLDNNHADIDVATGKFAIGPLPIGGTYSVETGDSRADNEMRVAGERIELTRRSPTREVTLRMVEGVPFDVQVVGPDGQPVPGAKINMRYKTKGRTHGGVTRNTDANGRYRFQNVNPNLDAAYGVFVENTDEFRSKRVEVKSLDKPLTIRLEKGLTIRGVLIEGATGKVIPDAKVWASVYHTDAGRAEDHYGSGATTDRYGRFTLNGLLPLRYRLGVGQAVHADVRLTENPDGSYTVSTPPHVNTEWTATGGQTELVELRVQLTPTSRLKPVDPL